MACTRRRWHNEHGSILVMGLLTLTILTLVGMAATTGSGIESDIAKNEKSAQQAVYAAELALVMGEKTVDGFASRANLDEGTRAGRYAQAMLAFNPTTYQIVKTTTSQPLEWKDDDSSAVNPLPVGMQQWQSKAPRYTIAEEGFKKDKYNEGHEYGETGTNLFRVTGRGIGGGNASQVLMDTIAAKRF